MYIPKNKRNKKGKDFFLFFSKCDLASKKRGRMGVVGGHQGENKTKNNRNISNQVRRKP